jgi:hypothetical protein
MYTVLRPGSGRFPTGWDGASVDSFLRLQPQPLVLHGMASSTLRRLAGEHDGQSVEQQLEPLMDAAGSRNAPEIKNSNKATFGEGVCLLLSCFNILRNY